MDSKPLTGRNEGEDKIFFASPGLPTGFHRSSGNRSLIRPPLAIVQQWKNSWHWIAFLTLILLTCHYSYKVDSFPQAWGDEQNNISLDYRFATFGERTDLTWISESYNQRGLPKLPLPWASWLRSLYHGIIGCSSFLGRMFSVSLILSSLLMTALIWPIRNGLNPRLATVQVLVAGLSPSLYFAARTIRFEQEILFLGCLSLFLIPCLLSSRSSPKVNMLIWSASGCLSGYAGACHPLGYVFVGIQLVTLLFLARAWRERDGLTLGRRLLGLLSGLAIPFALQAVLYAWDWSNWRAYITDTSLRFVEVKKLLIDAWAPQGPLGLGQRFPWLSATLHSFKLASISPFMSYEGSPLLSGLFVFQGMICVASSFYFLVFSRQRQCKDLPLVVVVWLAAGFLFGHFAYALFFSPNYTAYPYLGLFVPLGFAMLMIWSTLWIHKNASGRARYWVAVPILVLTVSTMICANFAIRQSLWVARAYSRGDLSSFDDHIKTMTQTGHKLGWADDSTPVYFDNFTWAAAGPNWKSLFEVSFNEKTPPASPSDRVSFSNGLYNQVFNYANWGQQTSPKQRLERVQELFLNRSISALVFDRTDEYHFWDARAPKDDISFWVGRIVAPGKMLWARARLPGQPLEFNGGGILQEQLSKGWYVVLVRSSCGGESCFRMRLSGEEGGANYEVRAFCIGPIHAHVPKALLINVDQPETRVVIEPSAAALPEDLRVEITPVSEWSAH